MPPAIEEQRVGIWCDRHLAGEPVAYLIGEWEFYGLPLDISESVLIPRPDTETLVDHVAMRWLRPLPECRVLDLCAGSGCIGLAIASQVPGARVVLGELDEGALRICRAEYPPQQSQRTGGILEDGRSVPIRLPGWGILTVIVCNPPYIPSGDIAGLDVSVRDYEPHLALDGGTDGLDFYRSVCRQLAGRAAHRKPPGLRGGHRAGRRRPAAHARRGLRRVGDPAGSGGHPPCGDGPALSGGSMPTPDDRRNDFVNRWASAHLPRKFSLIQEEETWQRRKTAL